MCEYCGCRGVPPIAELMEEHDVILVDAHEVRTALRTGDRAEVVERLRHLASHLDPHVRREEQGIFTALRDQGDWADEVAQLEGEHRDLDSAIAGLDVLDARLRPRRPRPAAGARAARRAGEPRHLPGLGGHPRRRRLGAGRASARRDPDLPARRTRTGPPGPVTPHDEETPMESTSLTRLAEEQLALARESNSGRPP